MSDQTAEEIAAATSAVLVAGSPLFGPAAPVVAALAPLLEPIVAEVHSLIAGGADPREAAKQALARATAADPGPIGPRADAIDAAQLARVRGALEHVNSEIAGGLQIAPPLRASLQVLADHAALTTSP